MPSELRHTSALIAAILAYFLSHGGWPMFAGVDKALDRDGLDAAAILGQASPGYVVRTSSTIEPLPEELLKLKPQALTLLPDSSAAGQLLKSYVATLAYLAKRERDFVPDPEGAVICSVGSSEILKFVSASHSLINPLFAVRLIRDLLLLEPSIWFGFSGADTDEWSISLSRGVRQFRDASVATYPPPTSAQTVDVTSHSRGAIIEGPTDKSAASEMASDPRKVFVVHGRDTQVRDAMFRFLWTLGLQPLEWESVVSAAESASPYLGDAVVAGIKQASAVIILFTPDDEVRTHQHFAENPSEGELACQSRPNVYFEAGLAYALRPTSTMEVHVGDVKGISDLAGRNYVRLTSAASVKQKLAQRLRTAGCAVNQDGEAWIDEDHFADLHAYGRGPSEGTTIGLAQPGIPAGRILAASTMPQVGGTPLLGAKLHQDSGSRYLLEITNRGGVEMLDIEFSAPDEAGWRFMTEVLPEFPFERLSPRAYFRVPVFVMGMGRSEYCKLSISARTVEGESYQTEVLLSTLG